MRILCTNDDGIHAVGQPDELLRSHFAVGDGDYVRHGDRWLFRVRRAHVHEDMVAVLTSGKVGEYFQGFVEMCQRFIRT